MSQDEKDRERLVSIITHRMEEKDRQRREAEAREVLACAECGTWTTRGEAFAGDYCSPECHQAADERARTVDCEHCAEPFIRERGPGRPRRFCSPVCQRAHAEEDRARRLLSLEEARRELPKVRAERDALAAEVESLRADVDYFSREAYRTGERLAEVEAYAEALRLALDETGALLETFRSRVETETETAEEALAV